MFRDFGFKQIVINSLLNEETSFGHELQQMRERYEDSYEWGSYACIPEMLKYLEDLELTASDLAKVMSLCFDDGNEIYFYFMPDWDGESDEFDVHSVVDAALLPNLKEVIYVSMCNPSLMDQLEKKGVTIR